ncbi:DNA polymerase [Vibrio parahaemolyticus]|uniref:DNA polymerase n=2 Tax=Vibrio parahaemolyticus TaxID=670 RepID=UPI001D192B58|nr:DNA polymerase [Vibrio parahaemolyticus]MCC4217792.1 DNA polymerase [Vibrio parahaemolyticus]
MSKRKGIVTIDTSLNVYQRQVEARFVCNGLPDEQLNCEQRQARYLSTLAPLEWVGFGLERMLEHCSGNRNENIRQDVISLYHKISCQGLLVDRTALADLIQDYKERLRDDPFSQKEYKALEWLSRLQVDDDGKLRTPIRPYHSITGRAGLLGTTPINGYKIFREKLLAAPVGCSVASVDYVACEVGILAALSGDVRLHSDYMNSDDLYEALLSPMHAACGLQLERKQLKGLLLMSIYGASPATIASKLRLTELEAQALLKGVMGHYPAAFKWLEQQTVSAYHAKILQSHTWQIHVTPEARPPQVRNWPIQMAGMEIINRACLLADQQMLKVVGAVHDCVYIESERGRFEQEITTLKEVMGMASETLLNGFRLKTTIDFVTQE